MRWYFAILKCAAQEVIPPGRLFVANGFADFEAGESGDGNILAELGDLPFDKVANGGSVLFDEGCSRRQISS